METIDEKPQLNDELIMKVLKHVKADLRRLEMRSFGRDFNILGPEHFAGELDKMPPCGTQACFAGWTVLLTLPAEELAGLWFNGALRGETEERAQELLGLDSMEEYQLFFSGFAAPDAAGQYAAVIEALKKIYKGRGLEFKEPE